MKLSIILLPSSQIIITSDLLQPWQEWRTTDCEVLLVTNQRTGIDRLPWRNLIDRLIVPVTDLPVMLAERYNLGGQAATGDMLWFRETMTVPSHKPSIATGVVREQKRTWWQWPQRYMPGDSIMVDKLTWQRIHGCNPTAMQPAKSILSKLLQ